MAHIPRDSLKNTRNREWLEQLDWFKLENYDGLLELTQQQLLDQLLFRTRFYLGLDDKEERTNIFPNTEEWQNVLSGNPIVNIARTSEIKKDNCNCLTEFSGISAISNMELRHYTSVTEVSEEEPPYIVKASCVFDDEFATSMCIECLTLFGEEVNSDFFDENESYVDFNELCKCCQSYVNKYNHKQPYHLPFMPNKCKSCNPCTAVFHGSDITVDDLLLKLNLADFTDIELMSNFSDLLAESRKKLKILEPKRKNDGVAQLYIKKIIRMRIIPYLDIRIWTIYNHVKNNDDLRDMYDDGLYIPECFQFTYSLSSIKKLPFVIFNKILFSNEKEETDFNQKWHKEYFRDYLNFEYINTAQLYLRKNPSDRITKVKNIIMLHK
jgi:hypothetical protein